MPTLAEKWMKQGYEQGFKEGYEEEYKKRFEEGQREATIDTLNQIITIRFLAKLTQLDLKSLKDLTEVALTVQNLAEFEEALAKLLNKSQAKEDKQAKDLITKQNTANEQT